MTILCYIENNEGKLSKASLTTISAALSAKQMHGYQKVVGLLIGAGAVKNAAEEASKYGLDEVLYVSNALLEPYLALAYEQVFSTVLAQVNPTLIVAAATTHGKDLLPRVAQQFDAGQASEVMEFQADGIMLRPTYAGNIFAQVRLNCDRKVVTVRTSSFSAATSVASACAVKELNVNVSAPDKQRFISFDTVKSDRPELSEAEVVISGGRALKSGENFEKYIAPLADLFNAAIGASRAAVDSGYAPNDWQVGQTGKIVAPKLYIAIGISGAIQHLAGMKDSKVIVAINTDPEAPIFELADYGLVGDLFEIIPTLIDEVKKAKS